MNVAQSHWINDIASVMTATTKAIPSRQPRHLKPKQLATDKPRNCGNAPVTELRAHTTTHTPAPPPGRHRSALTTAENRSEVNETRPTTNRSCWSGSIHP